MRRRSFPLTVASAAASTSGQRLLKEIPTPHLREERGVGPPIPDVYGLVGRDIERPEEGP